MSQTALYKHQEQALSLMADREYFALFMEQGTGKTAVTLHDIQRLYMDGKINGVLVLAPNGVHDNWARNEIPKHLHVDDDNLRTAVWHSSMGVKGTDRWSWAVNARPEQLSFLLANIEAVRVPRFLTSLKNFLGRKWMLVVDEATVIKNPKASQTKNTMLLAKRAAYRRILTGTPVTQGPLDLWSQCHVLSPTALPYPSYVSFRWEFAVEREVVMGNRRFRQITGYRNLEKLKELIKPFSFRVTKDECLDLPPKVYETRYVELTPEQAAAYRQLKKECLVMLDDKMLTVTMALTQLLRLQQIALGYAATDDGSIVPIPSNRIASLLDTLDQTSGPAIIFCRFLEDVRRIADALQCTEDHADTWVEYHGNVGTKGREDAIARFQNGRKRLFIATSAAARGLTLTAAQAVIYYSQDYRLETRLQSEDRAHRIGQTKTVVYTDLVARDTVDEAIIAALKSKQDIADVITGKDLLETMLA